MGEVLDLLGRQRHDSDCVQRSNCPIRNMKYNPGVIMSVSMSVCLHILSPYLGYIGSGQI